MWNCPECGCQAIAHDLTFCPMCFRPRADPASSSAAASSGADAELGEEAGSAPKADDEPDVPEPTSEPGETT